ncbi:MAG: Gfo/Idh/MocA family protein [Promethearchaeota archaeon]
MAEGKKKLLKVGMIGAGSSANNICQTIKSIEDLELVAISNHNIARAKELADKYGIPFVSDDYKKVCEHEELDFVVVSLPHGLHYEVVKYALLHGKHVLVEKPIATDVKEAEELDRIAREKGLTLGVHFQCRFFDSVQHAKKLIDSGELGQILQVNISVMWYRPPEYYQNNWRGTWKLEGGGSLINQAIHTVDEAIYLVGGVKKLFGFWDHKVHDIEVDDNTCAAFQFENGAFGTLQTSTSTKAAFPAKLTIFGTEGAIQIDGNILTIFKSDGISETIDYAQKIGGQVGSAKDPKKFSLITHKKMMLDFSDAIREHRDPMVTAEEGIKSLKVVRAVYESNGNKIIEL